MALPHSTSVLIVEDDPAIRTALQRHLTAQAFKVFAADNVEVACDLLRCTHIHAVISDVRLPNTRSGLEVLQFIRLHEEWKTMPVIMLTGGSYSPEEEDIIRHHTAYVFYKPVDFHELVGRLMRLTA